MKEAVKKKKTAYSVRDESAVLLHAKLKKFRKTMSKLDKGLDKCNNFDDFVKVRAERGNIQYHIDIAEARLRDDYKVTAIEER